VYIWNLVKQLVAMKTGIVFVLLLAASLPLKPVAAQSLGIAAVVNEEIISAYDLQSRISWNILTTNGRNNAETRRRHTKKVLDHLIDEKLKLQEAKRLGIKVSQAEIQRRVKFVEERLNLPSGGLYSIVRRAGLNNNVLNGQFKSDIGWSKVVNRVLGFRVKVGEEEIQDRIRQIELNKGRPEHRILEIFLPVDNPDRETQVANQARSITQQLEQGASFQSLAKNYSKSPTANNGGDVGWLRAGQLDPRLDAAIETMRPGQISQPIRTKNGYFILLLHSQRKPQEENKNVDPVITIHQFYLPLPSNPSEQDVAQKMKVAKAAKAQSKTCKNLEQYGKKVGSTSLNIKKIKLSSLAPSLIPLVAKLKVGESTELIKKTNGIVIYMLCDKLGKKKKDTKLTIRKQVEDQLINQRLGRMAQRYLRDLRRQAFVDIRL
jgi:peptidyl-prolyl cis-trans isomerase SurA